PDHAEPLDEDAVLVRAEPRPAGFEQGEVVIGDARRRDAEREQDRSAMNERGDEQDDRRNGDDIDRKLRLVLSVGNGVAADLFFAHAAALRSNRRGVTEDKPWQGGQTGLYGATGTPPQLRVHC